MCTTVYNYHLCGQLSSQIEFKLCKFKMEASEVITDAYDTCQPPKPEEEWAIKHKSMACKAVSQVFDGVSIKPNCAAEVAHLGEFVAMGRSVLDARERVYE